MKLLIHDMDDEEYKKIAGRYEGWKVISDDGRIKPCAGCFGCWVKNPGECVIRDGYHRMGAMIHRSDEVVIMSRYTYGGVSSFVKNVLDRSISFVLPFFEIVDGEMHHKSRYPEEKTITFIFRGSGLTDTEKRKAETYAEAVCRNLHCRIKAVEFEECEEKKTEAPEENVPSTGGKKTVLLNCSLRGDNANTKRFLNLLSGMLHIPFEQINIGPFIGSPEVLGKKMNDAEMIVLGMPLYVDGIPSAPLRFMEWMEKSGRRGNKKVYVIANMGFYESSQIGNLMGMVRMWCEKCDYSYCGGLAIGAGEMMGKLMTGKNIEKGPAANVGKGLRKLAGVIDRASLMEDIYADPNKFPRAFYMLAGNLSWSQGVKANGLKKKDLYRRVR
ncbi:MAG: flavodoxin family protein [Lachnospiraceae bacterium]|nr:flavodoxin family protein [Lachnospiraceae bacterium]